MLGEAGVGSLLVEGESFLGDLLDLGQVRGLLPLGDLALELSGGDLATMHGAISEFREARHGRG